MHARMEEIENTVEGLRNELLEKEKLIEELKILLMDHKKTVESNQQVITWLNKEINAMHKGGGVSLCSTYSGADELVQGGFPMNIDSSPSNCRFNTGRIISSSLSGGYHGPSITSLPTYLSPCMNSVIDQTPTKYSGVIALEGESPKLSLSRPHHITAYVPEPQPYIPRDKIVT